MIHDALKTRAPALLTEYDRLPADEKLIVRKIASGQVRPRDAGRIADLIERWGPTIARVIIAAIVANPGSMPTWLLTFLQALINHYEE